MMSRIKLNQELDFSFQLQRRKAFNQAKGVIAEKKKVAEEEFNQHRIAHKLLKKKVDSLEE